MADLDETGTLSPGEAEAERIDKKIEEKLRANLKIVHLEIVDTSGNCGSSYAITVVSPDFAKKMTLARHKMINQLLADEIKALHAFSQKTLTPEQWEEEKSK